MAEIWDEEQLVTDGFERVYAELDWYDGPREGLADLSGVPHYFEGHEWDWSSDTDEYFVWPASADAVVLEREQWAIYARWNELQRAGAAGPETHPGRGGIDATYDQLTELLTPHREAPVGARRTVAEWRFVGGPRYRVDGVDYMVRWNRAD